ncbi:MAG TPA: FAD binding domain-containing protein [Jatrophihabitantaceae bacterium]|nr:FAD binding domain-containing protein [Jatrophihabitantaceae bacterium]
MEFLRATSWSDAVSIKAERPAALPIAGGTDVMVEINFDRRRPEAMLDLNPVADLREWDRDDGHVVIGAGVPYTRLIDELGADLPGLAMASRTVGSPQIRNRGTLGGNLGSASPAGDTHPVLLALDATVEASSVRGSRSIAIDDFYLGVKKSALAPDELIRSVRVPVGTGPCHFAKIGTRNAMVIAVCSFAVALQVSGRGVRTGIGSAAPTPRRAPEAETFAASELDWSGRAPLTDEVARRFGDLAAAAAVPINDVRGTAAYRRHAVAVLARRTLAWAWEEYRACA